MRLLVLCLAVVSAAGLHIREQNELCSTVECRAGRECVVSGSVASCECVRACPDRYSPVCGSDGGTYDTHCLLHRHACLTGEHIKVIHKGMCKKNKKVKQKPPVTREDPAVCYSSQRDGLLDDLRQYWEDTQATQPWHASGMTYREALWGRFYSCDHDKDNYLEADELFNCTSEVRFTSRPNQELTLTRALCLDALVDLGDNNKDWRLDFEEFTAILAKDYHPPQKMCSLEGKKYRDGLDVTVGGSHCICAVGSWVCTSPEPTADDKKKKNDNNPSDILAFNYLDYDDEGADAINNNNDNDNWDEGTEQYLIDEDEDEEYLEDLFEDLLDKLREHRRKHHHHHNQL